MENASKALIIAGAILLAILIIGLGIIFTGQRINPGTFKSVMNIASAQNGITV